MQVLTLLSLVVDFGAKLEVVAEEVHDNLLILELEVEGAQIAVDKESDLVPSLLCLVEGVHQHVAIHGVFCLLSGIEVHACLDHEEGELSILLQLKVLESCLLEEESNQDGCALDLVGNSRHVCRRQINFLKNFVQLRNHDCILDQQVTLIGVVIEAVGFPCLHFELLDLDLEAVRKIIGYLGEQLHFQARSSILEGFALLEIFERVLSILSSSLVVLQYEREITEISEFNLCLIHLKPAF